MRITQQQWMDLLLVLGSYRADLLSKDDDEFERYAKFIDELVDEIQENDSDPVIEFEFTTDEDDDDEDIS